MDPAPHSSGVRLSISVCPIELTVFLRCIHVQCPHHRGGDGQGGPVDRFAGFPGGSQRRGAVYRYVAGMGMGSRVFVSGAFHNHFAAYRCSYSHSVH